MKTIVMKVHPFVQLFERWKFSRVIKIPQIDEVKYVLFEFHKLIGKSQANK